MKKIYPVAGNSGKRTVQRLTAFLSALFLMFSGSGLTTAFASEPDPVLAEQQPAGEEEPAFTEIIVPGNDPQPEASEATGQDPQPEATETAGEDPQPEATETAGEIPQPEATETAGETPQPEATETAGETPQPEATETAGEIPQPEATETAGEIPQPEATETAGENPQPEATETAGETPQPEATETAGETPQPEATETAGEDPQPETTDTTGEDPRPEETEATGEDPRPEATETDVEDPQPEATEAAGETEQPRAGEGTEIDLSGENAGDQTGDGAELPREGGEAETTPGAEPPATEEQKPAQIPADKEIRVGDSADVSLADIGKTYRIRLTVSSGGELILRMDADYPFRLTVTDEEETSPAVRKYSGKENEETGRYELEAAGDYKGGHHYLLEISSADPEKHGEGSFSLTAEKAQKPADEETGDDMTAPETGDETGDGNDSGSENTAPGNDGEEAGEPVEETGSEAGDVFPEENGEEPADATQQDEPDAALIPDAAGNPAEGESEEQYREPIPATPTDLEPAAEADEPELPVSSGTTVPEETGIPEAADSPEPEEEHTYEKELRTEDGQTYRIIVIITNDSGIPENAELVVRPIPAGTPEYEEYFRKTEEAVESGSLESLVLFDITLVNPDHPEEHYQPREDATVSVSIILLEMDNVEEGMIGQVIHFPDDDPENPEVLYSEPIADDSALQEFSFETGSFSVMGVATLRAAAPATSATVNYTDENGQQLTHEAMVLTAPEHFLDNNKTILHEGWFYVQADITVSGRLVIDGDVTLILGKKTDGTPATLTVPKGIKLAKTSDKMNSLTVYSDGGSGKLEIKSTAMNNAGIGGNGLNDPVGGDFTLCSGIVDVKGGTNGAGIGGGNGGAGSSVTVKGGTLTAQGGLNAAGIGGGTGAGQGNAVTISGGTVTATGGDYGAGIGGGHNANDNIEVDTAKGGNGGRVNITGGTVTATGGQYGAGIGGGWKGNGGQVTASAGSTVTATGGDLGGSGIGGGSRGSGGSLGVAGTQDENVFTTVTARTGRDSAAEAVGSGGKGGSAAVPASGKVILTSSAVVKAGASDTAITETVLASADLEGAADACRNKYAQITAGKSLNYAIVATLTHSSEKEKDRAGKTGETNIEKIEILSTDKETEIVDAAPGEYFVLRVCTSRADTEVEVTARDSNGNELALTGPEDSSGGKTHDYTLKMPESNVSIAVKLTGRKYKITIRQVSKGKLTVGTEGKFTGEAVYGDPVTLTNTPDAYDYYLATVSIREAKADGTTGPEDAFLRENGKWEGVKPSADEKTWVFNMPEHDVIIDVEYRQGVYYITEHGFVKVQRYFYDITQAYKSGSDYILNDPIQPTSPTNGDEDGWYVVRGNVTIKGRLHVKRFVNIILCDGASLTVQKGIFVDGKSGGALVIWAQHDGSGILNATGSDDAKNMMGGGICFTAGIGGARGQNSGAIIIHGGKITASGAWGAAGIGSGPKAVTGDIKIIPSANKPFDYVTIDAQGGECGAGIGGGYDYSIHSPITIKGGKIKAVGGKKGAGIGTGDDGNLETNITIEGGTIDARGGSYGAGIGTGCRENDSGADLKAGYMIKITGGTIEAQGGNDAAGIGTGEDGSFRGDVVVWGGSVTARSDDQGAGIGSGEDGTCTGWFKIYGGHVDARLYNNKGAPIGGGEAESGGNAVIKGGKVVTWSQSVDVGIGGAKGHGNGEIDIGDNMAVSYGSTEDNNDTRAKMDERVNKIQTRKFVVIEECSHPEHNCIPLDYLTHYVYCSYCKMDGKTEKHRYHDHPLNPGYLFCLDCGYPRFTTSFIRKEVDPDTGENYELNQAKFIADGVEVDEYLGSVTGIAILRGQTFQVKMTPGEGFRADGVTGAYTDLSEDEETHTLEPERMERDETGSTFYTFTMPFVTGDLVLTAKFSKIAYKVRVILDNPYLGTAYASKTTAYPGDVIAVRATPIDGYAISRMVLTYGGETRDVGITDGKYQFTMPDENAVVTVYFRKLNTALIYPVFEDENGDWPEEPAAYLDTGAVETFTVLPAGQIIPDETARATYLSGILAGDPDAAGGFEPKYYAYTYTREPTNATAYATGENQTVRLEDNSSAVYVYYARKSFDLTLNADFRGGPLVMGTIPVRYGDKLSAYTDQIRLAAASAADSKAGYSFPLTGRFADIGGAWSETPKTDGDYAYTALIPGQADYAAADLDGIRMPAGPKSLYPIQIRHRIRVILDLGAYDTEANADETISCQGEYWPEGLNSTHTDPATDAYMSRYQFRTFMTDTGEPIYMDGEKNEDVPAGTDSGTTGMNAATRTGYDLTGWYTQSGVRWKAGMATDPQFADDAQLQPFTNDAGAYYQYYIMTLTAHWELKAGQIVYDLNGGRWPEGSTDNTSPVLSVSSGETVHITGVEPVPYTTGDSPAPDHTRYFAGWKDPEGRVLAPGAAFTYNSISQVTEFGDTNNVIRLEAVYLNNPAGKGQVRFDTREGSSIQPAEIEFPEGSPTDSTKHVAVTYTPGAPKFSVSYATPTDLSGETVTAQFDIPTKKGNTFTGWADNPETTDNPHSVTVAVPYIGHATVYAVWNAKSYTIVFDTNGGSAVTKTTGGTTSTLAATETGAYSDTLPYGTVIEPRAYTATKDHYTFDGWSPQLPSRMPDEPLNVEAIWKPNTYQLTIAPNNGTGDTYVIKQAYQSIIRYQTPEINYAEPPAPQESGRDMTLTGWIIAAPAGSETTLPTELPATMPGEDRTYRAVWEILDLSAAANDDGTTTRVTVDNVKAGLEYRINGGAWQTPTVTGDQAAMVFDGLTPGGTYTVEARYAATNDYPGSRKVSAAITTPKQTRSAPGAPAGVAGFQTIQVYNVTDGMEYYLKKTADGPLTADDAGEWKKPDRGRVYFTGLEQDTSYLLYARQAETAQYTVSPVSEPTELTTMIRLESISVPEDQKIKVFETIRTTCQAEGAQDIMYQWYIQSGTRAADTPIENAQDPEFTPSPNEFGKNLRVTATQISPVDNDTTYGIEGEGIVEASAVMGPVETGKGPRAAMPVLKDKGVQFLTVEAREGEEYAIVSAGAGITADTEWVRPNEEDVILGNNTVTFGGLQGRTEYDIYARTCEAEAFVAGDPSEPLREKTDPPLTGIRIIGNPKALVNLTTALTPEDVTTVTYQWYRDGEPIPGATESVYQPSTGDIGSRITVRATQVVEADQTIIKEDSVSPVDRADGEEAEIPELEKKGTRTITVITEEREDDEFSIDGGRTWQKDGTFTGLKPDTTYEIIARKAETDERYAGEPSGPLEVTTDAELTGVTIEGTPTVFETLTAVPAPEGLELSYQWYRDGEAIEGATEATYTADKADALRKITVAATQVTADEFIVTKESPAVRIDKAKGGEADIPETEKKGTRTITVVTAEREDDEFSIDGGRTWRKDGTFTGLKPDTAYEIIARKAETEYSYAGKPSEPLKVSTGAELTGVKISGTPTVFETLTAVPAPEGLELSYEWYRDGEAIEGATEAAYTADKADALRKITVTATQVTPDGFTVTKESPAVTIGKAAGGDAETPVPEDRKTKTITIQVKEDEEYAILRDGQDISRVRDRDWKRPDEDEPDRNTLTFTGLNAKTTYQIYARKAETGYSLAGRPSAPLAVTTEDIGKVSSKLLLGKGVPAMTLSETRPDEIMRIVKAAVPEAEERRQNGEEILLTVEVSNADGKVSAEDRSLIRETLKKKASDAKDLLYLDISVYLTIGNDTPVRLTNLGRNPIHLTMTVPTQYKAAGKTTRTFHIVQVHDGKGTILASSQNLSIPFSSSLFSVFALGHSDKTSSSSTPGGGSNTTPSADTSVQVAVLTSRFIPAVPADMDDEDLLRKAEWIRKVREQYGKENTLLIGSLEPLQAAEATADASDPVEALADLILEAGYSALIPVNPAPGGEETALCAALAELEVPVPAANVYYDGTDGVHEAGENVFEPFVIRNVTVNGYIHRIGILALYCRDEGRRAAEGLRFTHPDNEDGTAAREAELYLEQMREEDCEFVIVCCYGDTQIPNGAPEGTLSPAEEMIRKNAGIDLLILPEDPEEENPAVYMTDRNGKRIFILREGEDPAGAAVRLDENSDGDLVCTGIQPLN